jgi:hypothetical protein
VNCTKFPFHCLVNRLGNSIAAANASNIAAISGATPYKPWIVDQWNPSRRRYRAETFCYGPGSCPSYRSGPARKVPGRRGMIHTEENWIDEEATSCRGPDE